MKNFGFSVRISGMICGKRGILSAYLILFLLAATAARADVPRAKGYYIDKENNRHEVMILVAKVWMGEGIAVGHHQNGFTYINKKGKKTTLSPKDADEYGFTYNNKKYVFHFLPNKVGGSFMGMEHIGLFHLLLKDGPCRMYQYVIAHADKTSHTDYVLAKSKEDLYFTRSGVNKLGVTNTNKKTLEAFFEDCPDLVEKIKTKEFKKGDDKWERMVDYYNSGCQSVTGDADEAEEQE